MLDRIDIVVDVPRLDEQAIISAKPAEPSAAIAKRVAACRQIQIERLNDSQAFCNAHMSNMDIKKYCKIDNKVTIIAELAMRQLGLSAHGYSRVIKVARTIADLDGAKTIQVEHFAEALQYRPRLSPVQQTSPIPNQIMKPMKAKR